MTARHLGRKPDADKPGFEVHREPRFSTPRAHAFPREFSLRQHVAEPLDQLRTSTCVSNQVELAYRAAWDIRGTKRPLGSRLHNYYHARAFTGDQGEDGGTYLHSGVTAKVKFGSPPESIWTFNEDPSHINRRPSFSAEHEAADWKGPERYHRIFATGAGLIDAIKTALFVDLAPVIFGTDVSVGFTMSDGSGIVDMPRPDEEIAGGHALGIYGWRDLDSGEALFQVNTSWLGFGPDNDGFFWIRERYATWSRTDDFNVIQLAP